LELKSETYTGLAFFGIATVIEAKDIDEGINFCVSKTSEAGSIEIRRNTGGFI